MKKVFAKTISLAFVSGMLIACSSLEKDEADKDLSSDIISSGCLDTRSDGKEYNEHTPFIVLAKEGDAVWCELRDFEYNCYVYDFNVVSDLQKASDGIDSLYVTAVRIDSPEHLDLRCLCHYNISFVVRNVMADKMHFHCVVPNSEYSDYDGIVTFHEGNTVVLSPSVLSGK